MTERDRLYKRPIQQILPNVMKFAQPHHLELDNIMDLMAHLPGYVQIPMIEHMGLSAESFATLALKLWDEAITARALTFARQHEQELWSDLLNKLCTLRDAGTIDNTMPLFEILTVLMRGPK